MRSEIGSGFKSRRNFTPSSADALEDPLRQMLHPDFAVRLDAPATLADFAAGGIDAAIRSGRGDWPGLESHLLFDQTFTAVASPAHLAREGKPRTPAVMLGHVLIAPSDEWWDIWFRAAGVATPITFTRPGIAIITSRFEAQSFAAGKLVQLFGITATSGEGYDLADPREHRRTAKIRLFRDWVLKEAASA